MHWWWSQACGRKRTGACQHWFTRTLRISVTVSPFHSNNVHMDFDLPLVNFGLEISISTAPLCHSCHSNTSPSQPLPWEVSVICFLYQTNWRCSALQPSGWHRPWTCTTQQHPSSSLNRKVPSRPTQMKSNTIGIRERSSLKTCLVWIYLPLPTGEQTQVRRRTSLAGSSRMQACCGFASLLGML